MDEGYLYRYEATPEEDGLCSVHLYKYRILKRTPKGAWICKEHSLWEKFGPCLEKRFVLLTAKKKYASKTKAGAVHDFICRSKRRIKILTSQLAMTEYAVGLAQYLLRELQEVDDGKHG